MLKEAVEGGTNDEGKTAELTAWPGALPSRWWKKLGTIPRRLIARDFKQVDRDGRFQIKKTGRLARRRQPIYSGRAETGPGPVAALSLGLVQRHGPAAGDAAGRSVHHQDRPEKRRELFTKYPATG